MLISRKNKIIKIKSKEANLDIEPSQIKIDNFIINSPGEYETKGVFVEAITQGIYIISLEQMRICYSNKPKLTDKELETINNIDILLAISKKLINQIEPKLVILIKSITDKISIKKKDLPKEGVKTWKS